MKPTQQDLELAKRLYNEFKPMPGSEFIAKEFALAQLSATLRRVRPKNVMELGAGIGTITKLLLEHEMRPEKIVATEDHPFCLEALDRNLAGVDRTGLQIVTTLDDLLAIDLDYELAICDGSFYDPRQFKGVSAGTVCYFEGRRPKARQVLMDYLTSKNLTYQPEHLTRPGFKLHLKKSPDSAWRMPAIKRPKGCWIGTVRSNSA